MRRECSSTRCIHNPQIFGGLEASTVPEPGTVVTLDPIYVLLSLSTQHLKRMLDLLQQGQLEVISTPPKGTSRKQTVGKGV